MERHGGCEGSREEAHCWEPFTQLHGSLRMQTSALPEAIHANTSKQESEMAGVEVRGLPELLRALEQLGPKIENNIMRGALRAGMKVIELEAKRNVPEKSGELRKTVRSGVKRKKVNGKLVAYVAAGPKAKPVKGKKAAKNADHGWYAHFVEFGTAAHIIKARPPNRALAGGVAEVHHPGAAKHPFIRPAVDTHGHAAIEAVRDYVRRRLSNEHGIQTPDPGAVEPGDEN